MGSIRGGGGAGTNFDEQSAANAALLFEAKNMPLVEKMSVVMLKLVRFILLCMARSRGLRQTIWESETWTNV